MAKTKKKNKGGGGTKKKAKVANKRSFNNKGGNNSKFDANTTPLGNRGGGGGDVAPVKVDNPFEIRMHRTKHDNLGRRGRHEKGVPGISRSKAIEKRRDTLLKEYKIRNKSSLLVDKRIGEKIKNMSEEEKIMKRTVMEKRRQYKQKSIFNLPSTDDILTHKGQMLTDIDRYDDPREESDSDDERLNEEFVSDAHFAGDFLKVKAKPAVEEGAEDDDNKTRKDIIAELILNSKHRKMEKAKEADENYELVTKLDSEFKTPDFRNLLNFVRKEGAESREATAKKEDYDKIVRELHFEAKTGLASNRLKTEDEIQEDELVKLKKLEKDRIRRMQAMDPSTPKHRSADELNDGYEVDEEVPTLSYQADGTLNPIASENESEEEESEEEEENAEEEEDDEEGDSDAFSDLESGDEEADANQTDETEAHSRKQSLIEKDPSSESLDKNDDIPFTLALPKSYESFKKLLSKYKATVKDNEKVVPRFTVVTERLVKYSLLADKSRTPELFVYLIRAVMEGVGAAQTFSETLKKLTSISIANLHSVLLSNPGKCAELMEEEIFRPSLSMDKAKKPSLSKIVLFQICSKLFCVTDFCHRVLSPIKVHMLDIIHSCSISSYMDLLKVLSLVDTIYEMSHESKRYCPEVSKLLLDILEAVSLPPEKLRFKRRRFEFLKQSSLESNTSDWKSDIAPVDPVLVELDDSSPSSDQALSLLLRTFDLIDKFIQSQHKTKVFNGLIYKFLTAEKAVLSIKWSNTSFHKALFSKRLRSASIVSQAGEVEDVPVGLVDRPKMIKLYEPLIEDNFDGNKKRNKKRKGQTQEEARLSHKVKKEMKSAVREILKDNAFLAKQQMKEQAVKDDERNRKVKELLGSLSNQEGDYRRIKSQK